MAAEAEYVHEHLNDAGGFDLIAILLAQSSQAQETTAKLEKARGIRLRSLAVRPSGARMIRALVASWRTSPETHRNYAKANVIRMFKRHIRPRRQR